MFRELFQKYGLVVETDYISVMMENDYKKSKELNDVTNKLIRSILNKDQITYLYNYTKDGAYWYNVPIANRNKLLYIGINNSLDIIMRTCIPGDCYDYESDGFCKHLLSVEEQCRVMNENITSIISVIKQTSMGLKNYNNAKERYNINRIQEENCKFNKFMNCIYKLKNVIDQHIKM